ncbi:MAG: anthranilate phosphoribosyltransferase [Proteobacteria bacterium]|jgi:anthranilate phosphoribosyltransferase|nr:anthranilate phosphoribosyltransferase [Pseudomonadota bacterium]
MNIQGAIAKVLQHEDLSAAEMQAVMTQIMTGEATPAQIGGFLVGLRMKGETVEEITAAAEVMSSLASHVELDVTNLIDIVGTGGDGSRTFNISTASTFVAAAAGAYVAKHGNRSVSSSSGSADLLEAAGVNLGLNPEQVAEAVRTTHVGFMFAPNHHSAMKHAIGPRKDMAVRTVFNVLGPLTNPARVRRQVVGVFAADLVSPIAEVLGKLGSEHAVVVHSDDGLDEISIAAPTQIAEWQDGTLTTKVISPADFGLEGGSLDAIRVNNAEESLAIINQVLDNQAGPARDAVVLNAGAGIYVSGLVSSLEEGVARAAEVIADGSALATRDRFVTFTNEIG